MTEVTQNPQAFDSLYTAFRFLEEPNGPKDIRAHNILYREFDSLRTEDPVRLEKIRSSLDVILHAVSSQRLSMRLRSKGVDISGLRALFNSPVVYQMIDVLLCQGCTNIFGLGVILSQIDYRRLSQISRKAIGANSDGRNMEIDLSKDAWSLCSDSEKLLAKAVRAEELLPINHGALLVKFQGYLTALCLRSVYGYQGQTFLKGNWYSPLRIFRRDITQLYDQGAHTGDFTEGSWNIMRAASLSRLCEHLGLQSEDEVIPFLVDRAKTLS